MRNIKKLGIIGVVAVVAFGLGACAAEEPDAAPEPTVEPAEAIEEVAAQGTLEAPIPFGESVVIPDLGEDSGEAWEITVNQPVDRTAEVLAFHDGQTGFEDEYPVENVHQVVDVTITRLSETPASPGEELEFHLSVDGIEEGLSPVVFVDGPRFRLLEAMQKGASIEYPLVFTVPPGEVGAVALSSPSGTVYFG